MAPAAFAVEGEQPATPETSTEQTTTPGESTVVTPEAEAPQDTQPEAVTKAVAQIGEVKYETLEAAVKAVEHGKETEIVLLGDAEGNGIAIASGNKITIDLGGFTYDISGEAVGSKGTETNGFQLLKDSNITFKNGTITSTSKKVMLLIQNYSNLTLDNVTLDGSNLNGSGTSYTLSNNNGEIKLLSGTNVKARSENDFAFDVCWAASYKDGARVTVEDGVVIDGNIELGLWGKDTYAGGESVLTINGGTFNGALELDPKTQEEPSDVKKNVKISGGTFTAKNSNVTEYLDEGCALDENGTVVPEENSVAKIGNKGYKTLADALEAVKETGGTITLLKDATLENAQYFIDKSVTINGSGKISCIVAAGETTHAFVVEENGRLTLDGVELDIKGTENADTAKKNDGTGIDVQHGGSLILKNKAVLNLHDLERATISSRPKTSKAEHPGQFIIDNSTFTITNIDGNASNGGDWKVTNESTVNVENCGSYGLSVDTLTTEKSNVNVSKTGYSGIYGTELQFKDGSNVVISEAGTKLPLKSDYSDVKSPLEVKSLTDSRLTVKSGANVVIQGCVDTNKKENNTVYIPNEATYVNAGNVKATIKTEETPDGSAIIKLMDGGNIICVITVKNGTPCTLNVGLTKDGYTFAGWSDGSNIYQDGDTVTVNKDTTFEAQWKYNGSSSSSSSGSSNRTLTFNVNGGSELKKLTKAKGTTIDLSDYIPTRTGYTFAGWYSDKELTEKVTSVKLSENTIVYAKWTKNADETVAGFTDVKTGDWFAEEVQYVVDKGLMSGTSKTTFAPSATTTRGMIVAILHRLEKEPAATASAFTDVKAGAYYEKAINWAAANDIVKGVTETTFAPDQAITREQMAAILYRYAQFKGYDMSKANKLDAYADAARVSAYAVPAMQWANAENLITGKSATVLDPKGEATRAQVASILMRFCESIAK